MPGSIQFLIALIVVVLGWAFWSTRHIDRTAYIKGPDFLGILKGVVIVVGVIGGLVLITGCTSGTYLNDASVFAGLDYAKKSSPMCEPVGPDDHTTSNIGARLNLYQSADTRFRTNLKATHHSCAFSPDDRQYDAIGVELEYKFWGR